MFDFDSIKNLLANEISNDISVTNEQCEAVVLLFLGCAVEIAPETSFDAGALLEELLHLPTIIITS